MRKALVVITFTGLKFCFRKKNYTIMLSNIKHILKFQSTYILIPIPTLINHMFVIKVCINLKSAEISKMVTF